MIHLSITNARIINSTKQNEPREVITPHGTQVTKFKIKTPNEMLFECVIASEDKQRIFWDNFKPDVINHITITQSTIRSFDKKMIQHTSNNAKIYDLEACYNITVLVLDFMITHYINHNSLTQSEHTSHVNNSYCLKINSQLDN